MKKVIIYENLVKTYSKDLYQYAVWLTNNYSIAEDLVQDTFIKAWKNLESIKDLSKIKSWLITVLRREYFNFLKTKKQTEEITDTIPYEIDTEEEIHILELRENIKKLSIEYREPLILQIIQGFSIKEISNILDLNEKTVSTKLFRAKKQLKDIIENKEAKNGRYKI